MRPPGKIGKRAGHYCTRHQRTFHLTCNNVNGGGNFIVTAKDPAGPWSEPVWLKDYGIDGSWFFDDDGKVYYSRAGADGQNSATPLEWLVISV
jgi:xylan 1,4-beta-xylosidase